MDETTTVLEPVDEGFSFDMDSVFNTLQEVFGFFRKIIDFLKDLIKPLLSGALDSVAGAL